MRILCKTCHRVLCVIGMKRVLCPGRRLGWPAGIPAPEIQIRMGKFMGSWDFKGIVLMMPKKQQKQQPTVRAHPNFCFLSQQRDGAHGAACAHLWGCNVGATRKVRAGPPGTPSATLCTSRLLGINAGIKTLRGGGS